MELGAIKCLAKLRAVATNSTDNLWGIVLETNPNLGPLSDDFLLYARHNCRTYHYGNMALVRNCCVDAANAISRVARRNGKGFSQADKLFDGIWNNLTDAEMQRVQQP